MKNKMFIFHIYIKDYYKRQHVFSQTLYINFVIKNVRQLNVTKKLTKAKLLNKCMPLSTSQSINHKLDTTFAKTWSTVR